MGEVKKLSDITYQWFLNLIEIYQKNYQGADKMTEEYMLKEIERFKK